MHMRKPPPPFFSANKMGAPYGLLLGTIRPDSSSSCTCFRNSCNSSYDNGYSLRLVGCTAGSNRGMENGVLCSTMGNTGSANTRGNSYSSSDNSCVEPSNLCSCSLPCAALCVTFKLPICSTVATYTTDDLVCFTNLDADTNSHVRLDSSSVHDSTVSATPRSASTLLTLAISGTLVLLDGFRAVVSRLWSNPLTSGFEGSRTEWLPARPCYYYTLPPSSKSAHCRSTLTPRATLA